MEFPCVIEFELFLRNDRVFLFRPPLYFCHSKSDARAAKVKKTARTELSRVKGTSIPIGRSSSHANMATKWRLHIEQKPNVRLPRIVQARTLEKRRDTLAWHMLQGVCQN